MAQANRKGDAAALFGIRPIEAYDPVERTIGAAGTGGVERDGVLSPRHGSPFADLPRLFVPRSPEEKRAWLWRLHDLVAHSADTATPLTDRCGRKILSVHPEADALIVVSADTGEPVTVVDALGNIRRVTLAVIAADRPGMPDLRPFFGYAGRWKAAVDTAPRPGHVARNEASFAGGGYMLTPPPGTKVAHIRVGMGGGGETWVSNDGITFERLGAAGSATGGLVTIGLARPPRKITVADMCFTVTGTTVIIGIDPAKGPGSDAATFIRVGAGGGGGEDHMNRGFVDEEARAADLAKRTTDFYALAIEAQRRCAEKRIELMPFPAEDAWPAAHKGHYLCLRPSYAEMVAIDDYRPAAGTYADLVPSYSVELVQESIVAGPNRRATMIRYMRDRPAQVERIEREAMRDMMVLRPSGTAEQIRDGARKVAEALRASRWLLR